MIPIAASLQLEFVLILWVIFILIKVLQIADFNSAAGTQFLDSLLIREKEH